MSSMKVSDLLLCGCSLFISSCSKQIKWWYSHPAFMQSALSLPSDFLAITCFFLQAPVGVLCLGTPRQIGQTPEVWTAACLMCVEAIKNWRHPVAGRIYLCPFIKNWLWVASNPSMAFNFIEISNEFQSEFWLRASQYGQTVTFCGAELVTVSSALGCWRRWKSAAVPWLVDIRTVRSGFGDAFIKNHAREPFTQSLKAVYLSFADFGVQPLVLNEALSSKFVHYYQKGKFGHFYTIWIWRCWEKKTM